MPRVSIEKFREIPAILEVADLIKRCYRGFQFSPSNNAPELIVSSGEEFVV